MATCEMCGAPSENLTKVKIEGTTLEVCPNCSGFGQKVQEAPMPRYVEGYDPRRREFRPRPVRKEVMMIIVDDFGPKIKNAREQLGLKQEEFAKRLNEKESIMQKIESGAFAPSIEQARKFEKALKIKLVEEYSEGGEVPMSTKTSSEGFTMADFIKDKRKK